MVGGGVHFGHSHSGGVCCHALGSHLLGHLTDAHPTDRFSLLRLTYRTSLVILRMLVDPAATLAAARMSADGWGGRLPRGLSLAFLTSSLVYAWASPHPDGSAIPAMASWQRP